MEIQRKFAIGVVVVFCLVSFGAQANPCDSVVVDSARALDDDGIVQIKKSAEKLSATGAVVRVRVMETAGSSETLDRYQADQEKKCASWQDVSGVRRNTLISFLYQTKGGSNGRGSIRMFFGEYWKSELEPLWMPILQNKVAPFLRSGQTVQGLVAGLDSLFITANAKATTFPLSQSNKVTSLPPSTPTDLSGLWIFLGGLAGCIALFLLWYWWTLRKRKIEERRVAEQKVTILRNQCASYIVGIDLNTTQKAREGLSKIVPLEDLKEIDCAILQAQALFNRATEKNSRLEEMPASNSNGGNISAAQFLAMADEYNDVLGELYAVQANISRVDESAKQIRKTVELVPVKMAQLEADIKSATVVAEVLENQRYRVAGERKLIADAVEKLTLVKEIPLEKNHKKILDLLVSGIDLATQATCLLQELPKKKALLQVALATEQARLPQIQKSINERRAEYTYIGNKYACTNCKLVDGNVDEAQVRLDDSIICIDKGKELLAEQDWDNANKQIGQALAWLNQAESYLQSVVTLKCNLDKAMDAAPKDLEKVTASLLAARTFIDTHNASLTTKTAVMNQALENASLSLERAKGGLGSLQCDILRVTKEIGKAESEIDAIMLGAKEEHDNYQRMLTRIGRLKRDVPSAISAAKEFIADHRSDVGANARKKLDDANSLFQESEREDSYGQKVEMLEKALKQARQAIKVAESDVEKKARERRAERERQDSERRRREEESYQSSTVFLSNSSSTSDYHSPASSASIFGGGGGGFDIGDCGGGGGGGFDL